MRILVFTALYWDCFPGQRSLPCTATVLKPNVISTAPDYAPCRRRFQDDGSAAAWGCGGARQRSRDCDSKEKETEAISWQLQSNICWKILSATSRKKPAANDPSPLARVLNLVDLVALGVGTTLGLGVYVLAGTVAKNQAGPAVILSFALAALASLLAAFCYAEFAARVPRAGSVYVYAYVTVGELIAFVIGWDLILEYAIGTASVSRGISGYIDSLADNQIATYLNATLPIRVANMAHYPDFFAFGIIAVLCLLLSVGVKESSYMNKVLTAINILTILTMVIAGSFQANTHNWNIRVEEIPANVTNAGSGGFFPFGMQGVVAGAATSFFGFVGFDCIATTSEEAKKPRKNIPLSIILSLAVVFSAYFSVSTVLSLMRPYYSQDENAPFPVAFNDFEMHSVKWIVTVGAIFALSSCLLGIMFPLPRVMYSMASDGLLFKFLARVNKKTKTPLLATFASGLLAGAMALLFDLTQLISMLSIGTLLAYSLVGLCVMLLRFSENDPKPSTTFNKGGVSAFWRLLVNADKQKRPSRETTIFCNVLIGVFFVLSLALCSYMSRLGESLYDGTGGGSAVLGSLGAALIIVLVLLSRQPKSDTSHLSFAAPAVPAVPCVSIFLNIYLMVELDFQTWLRFLVWLLIGGFVYFTYSIWNSAEKYQTKLDKASQTQIPATPSPNTPL